MKLKCIVVALFFICCVSTAFATPYFLVDSEMEWNGVLSSPDPPRVNALGPTEWDSYFDQLNSYLQQGEPYPPTQFLTPELYVYGGGGGGYPEDAGLVMVWGNNELPPGSFASAWKYEYSLDPDLSNAVIQVTVTPPSAAMINTISFGIRDVNGLIRSWWWNVPGTIPYDVPTTITIKTFRTGVAAAIPVASGYANNPAFNIKQSLFFIADENAQWVGGPVPVPPPGQPLPGLWNYWHNIIVKPNTTVYKGYFVKWSQRPEEIDPGIINGWDELSSYQQPPILADDWICTDYRPVTDIHWWGSFIGWTQPYLPPIAPKAFHIGIWTDVPANADKPYSHPGTLVWENGCNSFAWNFAGYDLDPREQFQNEACFQFNQLLSQDEWFYQDPVSLPEGRIYWLSIAALYEEGAGVEYPWGWKTRPHQNKDDAIQIQGVTLQGDPVWPPVIGSVWAIGQPVSFPPGVSWDLSFELTTNEPDTDDDGIPDSSDNCPNDCNYYQLDADGDGIGDVCDDPNNDGCGGCSQPACETEC